MNLHTESQRRRVKASARSPQRGVDLQGFAQHLGADVIHVVSAQVHLPQAGVAAQGVDQHGAPGAQAGLADGQRLQGLQGQRGNPGGTGRLSEAL